ncbi:MAG: hypothetical protein OSJ53_16340 [Kineothrix sp.]|nr:hypothetical protein [Kineothrix sp.]
MAGGAVTENGAAGDGDFPLLRTISYFIYEMAKNEGGNCHGGQFPEAWAWMPLLPPRPV